MNRSKMLALVLVALALALFFLGLVCTIAAFLPGFEELLVAASAVGGVEQSPFILGRPAIQAAMNFFIFMVPAAGAGITGVGLWYQANRKDREERAGIEERERWGEKALAWWLDRLTDASLQSRDLAAIVEQGRLEIYPHLAPFHAHWTALLLIRFGAFFGVLQKPSADSLATVPRIRRPVILRGTVVALSVVSAFAVLWGTINVASLTWFERMPVIDQETSAALLLLGISWPMAFAIASGVLSWGLLRLEREALKRENYVRKQSRTRSSLITEQSVRRAELLFSEGGASSMRLASGLLAATLEAIDPVERRRVLIHAYENGLLRQDRALDLRGVSLRNLNLEGSNLTAINLMEVRLDGAKLGGAKLDRSKLDGSTLRGAWLRGASLRGSSLRNTSFDGASCQQACFQGADLSGASFAQSNLWQAKFDYQALLELEKGHERDTKKK